MTQPNPVNASPAKLVLALAITAIVGAFLLPLATLSRSFSGEGMLLVQPGRIINFTNVSTKILPDFSVVTILTWLLLLTLAALAWAAFAKKAWLLPLGASVCILVVLLVVAFVRAVDVLQFPMLTAGTPFRRLPFRNFGPSIWTYLSFITGVSAVAQALSVRPQYATFFARLRGGVVPGIALLLSMVVGGLVILLLQPTPGANRVPQDAFAWFLGKADLLWFSFSTLFGSIVPRFRPSLDLAGVWQSLTLATPLIFTGLSLAFAFRAGLFNIGAPGQVAVGGIACMLVGVYLPAPWFVAAPLAVLAAALGGGLWGAIPGFLKARFGSSEVINTMMMNFIGSSLMVFLIGSNDATFFGKTFHLPFRAEGGEAKSLLLLPGSHLASINALLGVKVGNNQISWAVPLAVLFALLAFLFVRRNARALLLVLGAGALGLIVGLVLPRFNFPISAALASAQLNLSFFLALLAAVFYGVFMWRTKWGYELRAVGLAPKAAEYGGVNIARNTILAMAIAGALAGLASTHYVLGGALDEYRLKQSMPSDAVGFGGITISLLGQNTPFGVVASAILFGVLGTGGLNLDQALSNVSREIVTVLQALIVVFITTRGFLSGDFLRSLNNQKPKEEKEPTEKKEA